MNFFKNLPHKKKNSKLVAGVDLGSNSFHLLIGKVERTQKGLQIITLDNLKSPVKLASGLDEHKILDDNSKARAILALEMFGERLRSLSPKFVRAVATNTFRIAKNGKTLLKKCEKSLGFPIEIISGVEEARLIYKGVSHSLNNDNLTRLVIDVGGGSTEFAIGRNLSPEIVESIYVGCIKIQKDFFVVNSFNEKSFSKAVYFARKEIQVISSTFKKKGWDVVYGCSGTVKSIHDVLIECNLSSGGITIKAIEKFIERIKVNNSLESKVVNSLKSERQNVFYGGLAIIYSAFKELKIDRMELSNAALRLGVLYDIVGRGRGHDTRSITIEKFIKRYEVDREQVERIQKIALFFWNQFFLDNDIEFIQMSEILGWSVNLLEVGHSISHNSYHKHSAYLVQNSDMPGFSISEQQLMSKLILGHLGKLSKVIEMFHQESFCRALMSIRLAAIFSRSRTDLKLPKIKINADHKKYSLYINENWLKTHPLTRFTLDQETKEWSRVGTYFNINPDKDFNERAA